MSRTLTAAALPSVIGALAVFVRAGVPRRFAEPHSQARTLEAPMKNPVFGLSLNTD